MPTHNGFSAEAWSIYTDAVHSLERAQQQRGDALRAAARLHAQLQIAVDGLGTIADRGGEDWVTADRALTRMAEVE